MFDCGKRIRIVLLRWRDANVDHTCCGRAMYRDSHRCGIHLHEWRLGHGWWHNCFCNTHSRRSVYRSGKRVGNVVLQWRDLDYTYDGDAMYGNRHRCRLYLFRRILGCIDCVCGHGRRSMHGLLRSGKCLLFG